MATSVTVLCSNAKRINIKVTPNTSLLQVLEQACSKQNLNSQDFDLVHQRKVLDLSQSIRFANLPNNSLLELRPSQGGRQESKVAVCMQTEGGGRFIHNFSPTSTFWDIITHWTQQIGEDLLKADAVDGAEPVCLYMRKEVVGESKLKETCLRDLGLTSGSAVIRLFYRIPETLKTQAHVESLNLKQKIEDNASKDSLNNQVMQTHLQENSGWQSNEPQTEKEVMHKPNPEKDENEPMSDGVTKECIEVKMESVEDDYPISHELKEHSESTPVPTDEHSHKSSQHMDEDDVTGDNEEIIYVGDRDTVLYNARNVSSSYSEVVIPDDFFDVTVEDARYLYASLQKQRMELENQVLCTQAFKEAKRMERLLQFKNTVLRIHFPNQFVLQARFATFEKVSSVIHFLRQFLTDEKMEFQLFIAPPKTILEPDQALYEAGLVPAALVYFGCDPKNENILKPSILEKISSHKAACKAAKLIRQSSKPDEVLEEKPFNQVTLPQVQNRNELKSELGQSEIIPSAPSTSSKAPKWFRSGPK